MLETRPFGTTGLTVTALGFGAMQAGVPEFPEAEAARLLHGALDLGIRLIDTARSYGVSEERIGRHLAHRRDEYVLSTKLGYGVDGVPDWTYECVRRGVDAARDRLRTDVVDVVHLHSCPLDVLLHAGVAEALADAVAAGKVRVAAYSGENEALDHAIERASSPATRTFGAVQLSVNVCESHALARACAAREHRLGVLAKRPLAGLPWRSEAPPDDPPHAEYWRRFQSLRVIAPVDWAEVGLRYAAHAPGVDACLVGGTRLDHLRRNVEAVGRGPLPPAALEAVAAVHRAAGAGWRGVI